MQELCPMLFLNELGQLVPDPVSENQAFEIPLRRHIEEEISRCGVTVLFGDGRGIHGHYGGFE
jgi:hypothetical protein